MVAREHFPFHALVKIDQIADHPGSRVNWPAHSDFQRVVMTMPVRIITLSVRREVLLRRHFSAMQPVRCGKEIAAGEVSFHEKYQKGNGEIMTFMNVQTGMVRPRVC